MIERSRSTPLPSLATHRRQRGLTQRQLGELASVAHTTVQQLESLMRELTHRPYASLPPR
jgi:transcriptional regulator with XRE-family HTH domain